jgi:hypothetical protein
MPTKQKLAMTTTMAVTTKIMEMQFGDRMCLIYAE